MSRHLKYIFPIADTLDVCALQDTAGADILVLNGNLVNQVTNQLSFLDNGYSRSISLTSANNLAAVNFTISGIQNGDLLTEVLAGPDANTVYSDEIYDEIYSITTSGAANQVSVGTGYTGFFPLISINLEKDNINYMLTTAAIAVGNSLNTTIYATVTDIKNNGIRYISATTGVASVFEIKPISADDHYIFPVYPVPGNESFQPSPPYVSLLVHINGQVGQVGNSIEMAFTQI
jgi:hypothetical protein